MPRFLEIAVNVPQVTGVFHYHLPEELDGKVEPGHLVEVPFGRQTVQGVVLRFVARPAVEVTRPVLALVDPGCVLTSAQIELAQELSQVYLAPLADCIGLMLPPGLSQQADHEFTAAQPTSAGDPPTLSDLEKRLLAYLRRSGPKRGRQLEQAFVRLNWRSAAQRLERRGLVRSHSVLPLPTVRPKNVRMVQIASSPQEIEAAMDNLGRPGTPALARRQAAMQFLQANPGPVDIAWVFAESGCTKADLDRLAELGLVSLGEGETWRDPLAQVEFTLAEAPRLSPEQAGAWDTLREGLLRATRGEPVRPYLLHGVTGSGKTELYLRAVEEVISTGRQALVLVPEISLTPQAVQRFLARFPGQVGLIHSGLSAGERYDTWRRARLGQLGVIVGPRSALFAPLPSLGLIVVDEFHDDSYYQSESPPFYHTREAALIYARLAGAVCLLGSATPDIATRYRALQNGWQILGLPNRILAHKEAIRLQAERWNLASHYQAYSEEAETIDLPPVQVVDMRQELKDGNRSIFSRSLQEALRTTLAGGRQAILFLNRRGSATFVFCRDCGYSLKCPRCDLPLTYHLDPVEGGLFEFQRGRLVCHHCNYTRSQPKTCPACGSRHIRQYGAGTESVEKEVKTLFPDLRTLRWDYETTRQKGSHDIILSHFVNHRADLLIGTQMIAKGLDLPLVTLVGMVLADVGLSLPDYRAGERAFQILTQVAGRAGRSPLGGQVILQTFQPDHYVIRAAARHDYHTFYQTELEYRRQLGYPPFTRLVRLEYRHSEPEEAEAAARTLAAQIRQWLLQEDRRATDLIGPAPCFFARLAGIYRWQIILRGPDPLSLLRDRYLGDWRIEADPASLL